MKVPAAVILVLASVVAFASAPPASSDKPTAAPATKESDRELVRKRMRLCRQRPELCVQHPEKKAPEPSHSPAPDGAGK